MMKYVLITLMCVGAVVELLKTIILLVAKLHLNIVCIVIPKSKISRMALLATSVNRQYVLPQLLNTNMS